MQTTHNSSPFLRIKSIREFNLSLKWISSFIFNVVKWLLTRRNLVNMSCVDVFHLHLKNRFVLSIFFLLLFTNLTVNDELLLSIEHWKIVQGWSAQKLVDFKILLTTFSIYFILSSVCRCLHWKLQIFFTFHSGIDWLFLVSRLHSNSKVFFLIKTLIWISIQLRLFQFARWNV